jgi:acyl-CoA thioesterase FadM
VNLFFRLVWVFLKASFAKTQIDVTGSAVLKFRVWLTDQDMFAHLTNSRYMSFSDLGTINFIIRSGFWGVMRKRGWFPVICAQSMTISRMLKTPQAFEVTTQIVGWNETYVGISHTFTRHGNVHAQVNVLARFTSGKRKKIAPQDVIEAAGSDAQSPEIPDAFARLILQIDTARDKTRNTTLTQ